MNKKEILECKKHGMCVHTLRPQKKYPAIRRCNACAVDAVKRRKLKIKKMAIEYKGGKCFDCELVSNYDAVYEFHHMDPTTKDFHLAKYGHCRSWARVKSELDKCVLLCANCHRIRHAKEKISD